MSPRSWSASASTASPCPATATASRSCVADTAAGERVQPLECALTGRDGDTRQFEILFTNLIDDEHVGGILLNARDVSERKAFEAELAHQAFHDPVTGLANRAMFAEQVRQAIARARREERAPAVIFLDLDDFKTVNDSLGHAAGDEVLVEFAAPPRRAASAAPTSPRASAATSSPSCSRTSRRARPPPMPPQRILELLAQPMQAGHRQVTLSGSIGISVFGPERRARRRRADPRRRRRDVHRQARRQGRLPAVRARDARGRRRPRSSCATISSARSPPTSSSCTTSP